MQGHGPANWVQNFPIPFGSFVDHPGKYEHVNSGLLVTIIIAVFSVLAARHIRGREEDYIVPPNRASLAGIADYFLEITFGIVKGVLGDQTHRYFSFIGAIFIFVLASNLFGIIPYGGAPTNSLSTTFALGLASFVFYNVMGIREMGVKKYLAHFTMGLSGVLALAVVVLEIVSHLLRPLTLGVRLGLNIVVDHTVLHIFKGLVPWFVPVPLMLFGLVVCLIQAFVFTALTAVYIQMATAHHGDHPEGDHH